MTNLLFPSLTMAFMMGILLGFINWVSEGYWVTKNPNSMVFWPLFPLFFWYISLTETNYAYTISDRKQDLLENPQKSAGYGFALFGVCILLLYLVESFTTNGIISIPVPYPEPQEPGEIPGPLSITELFGTWTWNASLLSAFVYFHVGHYAGLGTGALLFAAVKLIAFPMSSFISALIGGVTTGFWSVLDRSGRWVRSHSPQYAVANSVRYLRTKSHGMIQNVLHKLARVFTIIIIKPFNWLIKSSRIIVSILKNIVGVIRGLFSIRSETDTIGEEKLGPTGEESTTTPPDFATRKFNSSATVSERTKQKNTIDAAPNLDLVSSPPSMSLSIDDIKKEEKIGEGGNADVYMGKLPSYATEPIIAIKEPRVQGTLHYDIIDRFMSEAETWQKIDQHDHIVGVIDYGSSPFPWIALEFMDGGDLSEAAKSMSIEQKCWTAMKIAEGVHHAHHHGVAHLDLKPQNILMRKTGHDTYDVPKIADWGLAKMLLEHSKTIEGLSVQYAAPEQFDSEKYGSTDTRTDVYQLGAVFYELFTGRPPFEGTTSEVLHSVLHDNPVPPSSIRGGLPDGIDELLLGALAKSKTRRFDTVVYLRDSFHDWSNGEDRQSIYNLD